MNFTIYGRSYTSSCFVGITKDVHPMMSNINMMLVMMRNFIGIVVAILTIFSVRAAEDMQQHLNDTKGLVSAGKYAEALKRHIWFHENALQHDPSMYGVRLSFALRNWKQLGDKYPPAKIALIKTRDQKAKAILGGERSQAIFHDVVSINEVLEEVGKTVSLFEAMDKTHPDVANEFWDVAKEAIIAAKRYDLIEKYIGDLLVEYDQVKLMYDRNMKLYDDPLIGGVEFKSYNENNFVEECLMLIEVATAIGKTESSLKIQSKAFKVVKDSRLKKILNKK